MKINPEDAFNWQPGEEAKIPARVTMVQILAGSKATQYEFTTEYSALWEPGIRVAFWTTDNTRLTFLWSQVLCIESWEK